jgi:hypothetical protein
LSRCTRVVLLSAARGTGFFISGFTSTTFAAFAASQGIGVFSVCDRCSAGITITIGRPTGTVNLALIATQALSIIVDSRATLPSGRVILTLILSARTTFRRRRFIRRKRTQDTSHNARFPRARRRSPHERWTLEILFSWSGADILRSSWDVRIVGWSKASGHVISLALGPAGTFAALTRLVEVLGGVFGSVSRNDIIRVDRIWVRDST